LEFELEATRLLLRKFLTLNAIMLQI
jgi:hypothetical protein